MSYYYNSSSNYPDNSSINNVPTLLNSDAAQASYNDYSNQASYSGANNPINSFVVTNSTLEPTAPEFQPSMYTQVNNSNSGAIKKRPQNNRSSNYNSSRINNYRYGSGRTFNSARSERRNDENNPKSIDIQSEEQSGDSSNRNVRRQNQYSSKSYQENYQRNKSADESDNVNLEKTKYSNYSQNSSYRNYKGGRSNYFNRNTEDNNEKRRDGYSSKSSNKVDTRGGAFKYFENKRPSNKDNWRKPSNEGSEKIFKQVNIKSIKDAASQRERLEEMINARQLECLVCCEKIKNTDRVWSCMQCYHILHLHCTIAWAKSSKVENGWRCPACQNVCNEVPTQYKCYCGKSNDPKFSPSIMPHSCGEMCLRKGRSCDHKCKILCHPGPCPDCTVIVAKPCGCGATTQSVKCCSDLEIICDSLCNKELNCGVHKCKERCHQGSCQSCSEKIIQECFCGKVGRRINCTLEYKDLKNYSCNEVCGKLLGCGNHKCEKLCHEGPCDPCSKDVDLIKTCPCGKSPLNEPRKSCLDPIPCCGKICEKQLKCGQPSKPHICKSLCHDGDCPPCPLTTVVRCRCGHMDKELPCQELTTKADDARCEKKCTKKRNCGKHRCNQFCCIEIDHIVCPLPCNHLLSCGKHRCAHTCHSGRCPPCLETSFEELYCECGASVLYPPIPCGTKPPICQQPCSRQRPCGHPANHNCHTGPCPPCTILCKRWCYGQHEQRSAIPCHQQDFSCGFACGKRMPCGRHKCVKPCHDGDCPIPCKQPCTTPRQLCGHPCGKPCHDPPCPESTCKFNVPITCSCGLQKGHRPCTELTEEFRMIEMAQIKDKIGDLSKGQTVDITDINKLKKPIILKILECTEECRVLERNRKLAIGLQIRNPDISQKLTPRYTDFMRSWAKKDPHFCQKIHDKLTELVQLAKQSKQKSRSYSFESMNRDKRHFVHEYCEHFGCDSAAYDMEPNRNIVATAIKDKSWLPSMSLLEVIKRENGQRKVPGPILSKSSSSKSETVSLKLPGKIQRPSSPHSGEIVEFYDPVD